MQIYETTIVIDSLQKSEEIQITLTSIENFIKNNGGAILIQEDWGKKRLAYEINKKQYGNYHHIVFESQSNVPGLLEKEYHLQESILTHLTVKVDSMHMDKLKQKIAEQQSDGAKPAPAPAPEKTAAKEPEAVVEAENADAESEESTQLK